MDLTRPNQNKDFELRGVHHLALVARDMAETVEFYENVLDMPLIKTLDMPEGQHFFSDCGAGDTLAFFWFPDAPEGIESVSHPPGSNTEVDLVSGVGSMNYLAFSEPLEKMQEYNTRLRQKGVATSSGLRSPTGASTTSQLPDAAKRSQARARVAFIA